MKTADELKELKEEVETMNKKLHELTEEELEQVSGGCGAGIGDNDRSVFDIVKKLLETIKDVKEQTGK